MAFQPDTLSSTASPKLLNNQGEGGKESAPARAVFSVVSPHAPRALEPGEPQSREGMLAPRPPFCLWGKRGRTGGRCCHLMFTQLRLCRDKRCWEAAGDNSACFFAPSQAAAAATGNPGALRNDREGERESEVPLPRLVTSLLPPFFFFFPVPIKNLGLASNFPAKANQTQKGGGKGKEKHLRLARAMPKPRCVPAACPGRCGVPPGS